MKLAVEITDEETKLIKTFLVGSKKGETNSHGPLDMKAQARMVLEDVVLVVRRPGSWEGANMWQVLASHGYPLAGVGT